MHLRANLPSWFVALPIMSACGGEPPSAPAEPEEKIRTLIYHRQDSQVTFIMNSDGTDHNTIDVGGANPAFPLGAGPAGQAVALLGEGALLVGTIGDTRFLDTAISPLPDQHSLAGLSHDERYLALVSYVPDERLLVYDRANKSVDTLQYGGVPPVLAPAFSPDNSRIALVAANALSLFLTVITIDSPGRMQTDQLGFSRFANIPLFGWPQWTSEGLLLAVLRQATDAPDTLVSLLVDPDRPGNLPEERFRAVLSPETNSPSGISFGSWSTFSYSPDGEAIVLGAHPGSVENQHGIYYLNRHTERIRTLVSASEQFPIYPLLIN